MRLSLTTCASFAAAGALLLSLPSLRAQQGPPKPRAAAGRALDLEREHRAGRLVVRLAKGVPAAAASDLAARVGARSKKEIWPGLLWRLELAPKADLRAALELLAGDPRVAYAQPSWTYHAIATPDDTDFSLQWNMDQANDADIDAPEAWDVATDASAAIVAVIDTGVQYDHPDLAANIWVNPNEIAGNGIDDDGNGWIDDVHGIDVVNGDGDPMDDMFHGTHCAGIIGAAGNNTTGVAGVCWTARIMAVKFLDAGGSGDTADAVTALQYAVANGARVSSNSWGGYGTDQALYDAISAAGDAGMLFCAAAGNNSIDIEGQQWLPGGFDLANVVDVAATDANDNLAWFSNWGATSVDLGAPGDSIYSTFLGSTYTWLSGTSMACPHVAGVATMVFAQSGTTSHPLVKRWILDSVDPLASLAGITVTGGRLNYASALAAQVNAPASATNYGSGYPGTLGVPSLTTNASPVLGLSFDLVVGNSLGSNTPGLLLVGFSSASIPTTAGGTLLVSPLLLVPFTVDAAGTSLPAPLPAGPALIGVHVYTQVLESDAGAAHHISFTEGLDLLLGT
ncbi:MAG TPA: S8 family peptidase [Planctomycetota bacterium]|jgi:subtilisin family serine protease|nr:S8 family peptidase [Planctomycetota bacterium]